MPKKTILSDVVSCSPSWELPTARELEAIDTGRTLSFVREHAEGLRRIQIESKNKIQGHPEGVFQTFELASSSDGSPIANLKEIAALVRARGIRHAFDNKAKTTYRVWFHYTPGGVERAAQHQFTIDPKIDNDYLEIEEELDGDEQDVEEDAEFDPDEEPDHDDDEDEEDEESDDEDEEEDEEDEDEDEREEERPRVAHRDVHRDRPMTPTRQPSPLPPSSRMGTHALPPRVEAEPVKLPPSMTPHPSIDYQRQHGVEVKPEEIHMQVNPDFLVAVLDYADRRTERMFAPIMRELRLGMKVIRRESSALARDSRLNARRAEANATRMTRIAHARAAKAEEKLLAQAELNTRHYENFQIIAQQGWTAFRNSMDREAQTYVMQREYDKALLGQQLMFERGTDRTGAAGGIMTTALPIGAAIASGVFRKRGDNDTADLFAMLAKLLAPKALPDDDDDDDDAGDLGDDNEGDDDVIDTKYSEKNGGTSNGSNGASGPNGAHATGRPNCANGASAPTNSEAQAKFDDRRLSIETPAIYRCRKLLASMDAGQIERVRKILPVTAWTAINEAANATLEEAALASMVTLKTMIESNPMVAIQVRNELNSEQNQILMQLVQIAMGVRPKPRGMPRRPSASAG